MIAAGGPPLVLGIGNLFRRDDGAGVRVVQELWAALQAGTAVVPAHTGIVDGGTAGLGLLPVIAATDRLVIVDAMAPAGHPGRVAVLRGAALLAPDGSECALDALLATAALAGVLPADVTVVGIEAEDTSDGEALTPSVAAGIGPAVAAVIACLGEREGAAA